METNGPRHAKVLSTVLTFAIEEVKSHEQHLSSSKQRKWKNYL